MSTELIYLTLTMVLAASLWIPYIVGVNLNPQPGVDDFARPPPLSEFPPWVHRAHRAHLNLIETAMPFAALVLLSHSMGISNGWTTGAAIVFFWVRVAHAVGMISGWARFPTRPVIFTVSWLCTLVFAWQILMQIA